MFFSLSFKAVSVLTLSCITYLASAAILKQKEHSNIYLNHFWTNTPFIFLNK